MSTLLHCPNCHRKVDTSSELVDQVYHGYGNDFIFECDECGAECLVSIDWEPDFYIHKDTIKLKEKKDE
jgi:uncharacterized Zn finger protein